MSIDLDIDLFIAEVHKRPGLYDKESKEYSDKIIKDKLWDEVSAVVVENWNELTAQEKREKGKSSKIV